MPRRGVTVWFTGLSGAGKTTIALQVEQRLRQRGVAVERLDGDVVRQSLTRDLGFAKADRDKNIERVTFVAKLLTRNGVVTLAAFISPYQAARAASRSEIGDFLEVFVTAPLDTLIERDTKGLYKKALAGQLQGFTGINDPYEAPTQPDLVLHTDRSSVDECTDLVIRLLEDRGYLAAPAATSGLGRPHGGVLVDRELAGAARTEALAASRDLLMVRLDARELADLEMIGTGALSPLTGFMDQETYARVVADMRLPDGLVWSLPITLAVDRDQAAQISIGARIALGDAGGRPVALMQVTDKFAYQKRSEAEAVFGTADAAHPGVQRLYAQGDVYLGGPVWVLDRPGQDQFAAFRLTPRQVRAAFAARGWRQVVAFQTRNPVHRAHEYIQKAALETVDGLLLHPLVGATKDDDISAAVRMQSYQEILGKYYPQDRVLLAVFPAAMRYAGPREAIFHAICRKNYGCTHFIVGRDHAGVGNYYGTYAAQEVFDQFTPAELGIAILKFEHSFFCTACGNMATRKTCPHDQEHHVFLSGTRVRALLQAGELPPPEFTRPEVARILMQS